MIGHEKLGDRSASVLEQIKATTNADIQHWYNAVVADEKGDIMTRDSELWAILNFQPSVNFGDVDPNRVGNSIQDLRLNLKGYRFYLWIQENGTRHPSWAAFWLTQNLQGK